MFLLDSNSYGIFIEPVFEQDDVVDPILKHEIPVGDHVRYGVNVDVSLRLLEALWSRIDS